MSTEDVKWKIAKKSGEPKKHRRVGLRIFNNHPNTYKNSQETLNFCKPNTQCFFCGSDGCTFEIFYYYHCIFMSLLVFFQFFLHRSSIKAHFSLLWFHSCEFLHYHDSYSVFNFRFTIFVIYHTSLINWRIVLRNQNFSICDCGRHWSWRSKAYETVDSSQIELSARWICFFFGADSSSCTVSHSLSMPPRREAPREL